MVSHSRLLINFGAIRSHTTTSRYYDLDTLGTLNIIAEVLLCQWSIFRFFNKFTTLSDGGKKSFIFIFSNFSVQFDWGKTRLLQSDIFSILLQPYLMERIICLSSTVFVNILTALSDIRNLLLWLSNVMFVITGLL